MSATRSAPSRFLLLAALGGLAIGVLTSFGQTVLPDEVRSLANAAGSWSAAAFLLALPNRDVRLGALLGAVALAAMLAGYELAGVLRGFPMSRSMVAFWGLAAIVVGPVLGAGAAWVRGDDPRRIAIGAAPLAGILAGEAAYGLTVVADTTSPVYWWIQGAAALAIVVVVGARTRSLVAAGLCAGLGALVAVAFVLAYTANPLVLLSARSTDYSTVELVNVIESPRKKIPG